MTRTAFEERMRQRRRRRWKRGLLAALVVALVGAAVWAIWFSDLLVAQKVRVSGVEQLTEEQVVQAAEVPLGTPLARLDTEAIEERVTDALPPALTVDVSRGWPDAVSVSVTEREAVAWVQQGAGPWLVDGEGVVFLPADPPPEGLLELQVDTDDEDVLAAAAQVADEVRSIDPALANGVAQVRAETVDSVELALADGRMIMWGSAGEAKAKLRVLKVLLNLPASEYDVSVPTRPTTRE
ncbi:FtsQ-type POTRA domain-containing protein [Aeromicrobium sp. YIM 150415]|uniref:cell division protein FtsQ/DivIB n=1 Tax=Aeromicrobium sp. YIM 150415 TaxID=2803912 RepID=UPI00196458DF|nr:FtsQ-type POTRA domain-containing protein [Aeromicrobium sp. YIM 150415]MBM9464321.1 FtsQ-type POTRA domain-containing protein [Aeromicrobium sp. YIM 150415]